MRRIVLSSGDEDAAVGQQGGGMLLSRAAVIDPVGLKVPAFGSYSSAEARNPWPLSPPAMRTRPSDSRVAVWLSRAAVNRPRSG